MSELILSSTITHPKSKELVQYEDRQGVALVIVNRNKEVLLVQQRHNDMAYGRLAGNWNTVTETREDNELVRGTVWRAIKEELGVGHDTFRVIDGTYRETNGAYIAEMGYDFKFRCIALMFEGDGRRDPNELFSSVDGEIECYAWVSVDDLGAYNIEKGAQQVLDYYQGLSFFQA